MDYATIPDDTQSTLFTIISNDETSITFHNSQTGTLKDNVKVLDGIPKQIVQDTGFPYVLVQTPYTDEGRVTTNKFKVPITAPIKIYDKKEKNVRRIIGAIRNALISNQSTTRAINMFELQIKTFDVVRETSESSTLYIGLVNAEYVAYVST